MEDPEACAGPDTDFVGGLHLFLITRSSEGTREVRMRDNRSLTSILRLPAVLCVAALVVSSAPAPAQAHTLSNHFRQRRHIANRALSQRGADYRWGGASPRTGFDCSGLTRWTYRYHGALLPHNSMDQWRLGRRTAFRRVWRRKRLVRGDLVFFKTTRARVGHVGIYVGRGRFVHASSGSGRVRVSSVWDRYYYGPRWVGAVRPPAIRR